MSALFHLECVYEKGHEFVDAFVHALQAPLCPDFVDGDFDGNGVVQIIDIVLATEALLGISQVSECLFPAVDLNSDGLFNVIDVVLTLEIIVGK